MDNDIENIFSRQAEVLPEEVRRFVASGSWEVALDGIIAHYRLSEDDTDSLRTEISLVLAGLVHPNEFRAALGGELQGVDGATLDALAGEIEANVFASVRPMLERFFAEQEEAEEVKEVRPPNATGGRTSESEVASPTVSSRSLERMRDVAPDNLPTGEEVESGKHAPLETARARSVNPSLMGSKVKSEETHPFEERMKKVFTGGTADMGELALSPALPSSPAITSRSINDPYREPVE